MEIEISKVEISGVEAKPLDGSGFMEIHEPAPPPYGKSLSPEEVQDPAKLADRLKNSIRDIAMNLLAEDGIGSNELGYLYGVLVDHIRNKMLGGKTIGSASINDLKHALNCLYRMEANIKGKPGLTASIVKYKPEVPDADQ